MIGCNLTQIFQKLIKIEVKIKIPVAIVSRFPSLEFPLNDPNGLF
jgi:hypothetical protein